MIGYRITLADLEARIDAESPGWRADAAVRTAGFASGSYSEKSSTWSKVKPVYMRLQGEGKCAFCERKLESVTHGRVEQDVEHFRPKKGTKPWPVSPKLVAAGVTCAPLAKKAPGYHLLAYHPFNYCASCTPCNRVLKGNYFPVAVAHDFVGDDPRALQAERPYLIYPIGDFDEAPEDLIEFLGYVAMPVCPTGHRHLRALVTIRFFHLNSPTRMNLLLERSRVICALWPQLQVLAGHGGKLSKSKAQETVDFYLSPKSLHTNCAHSFVRLCQADLPRAEKVFGDAHRLIKRNS